MRTCDRLMRLGLCLLLFLLVCAGCGSVDYALEHDPLPGLFIKGNVDRVRERKVAEWMFLGQDPADILCSVGIGSFWGSKAAGDMFVLGGKGYIRTTIADADRPFGQSKELVRTPFSFGIARGHAARLQRAGMRFEEPQSISDYFAAHAEGRAVLALVHFRHLEGYNYRRPPLISREEKLEPSGYINEIVQEDVTAVVFGVALRDSETNRENEAFAEILKSVMGVNLDGPATQKLHLNVKALLLAREPDKWPAIVEFEQEVGGFRFRNVLQVEEGSTLDRAMWQSYRIDHINPPPGRRYIPPTQMSREPPPYIPLPVRRRQ